MTDALRTAYVRSADEPHLAERLRTSVGACVQAMRDAGRQHSGMMTTLTAVAMERGESDSVELAVAHVADSRAYLIREDGTVERLTRDHGFLSLLADENIISPETANAIEQSANKGKDVPPNPPLDSLASLHGRLNEAFDNASKERRTEITVLQNKLYEMVDALPPSALIPSPAHLLYAARNVILQSLHGRMRRAVEVVSASAKKGDVLVLCSDGVSDPLTDAEIADIVRAGIDQGRSAADIAADLTGAAQAVTNARAKKDDRGAVVVIL